MLHTSNTYIDDILDHYQPQLGKHYIAYRNHVYRVFNLTLQLRDFSEEQVVAIAIAAAFHDIGIWTAHTFDYLNPSIELARNYALTHGQSHQIKLISNLIDNHHKLSAYKHNTVVEAFRRADLIDLSLNLFRFGVKRNDLKELNKAFPGNGFHRFIFGQIGKNILRHPLNPLPIVKF